MKKVLLILFIFNILNANELTNVANTHLRIVKKDLGYELYSRYSIQQFTRALKLLYYDKKREVYEMEKRKKVEEYDF